MRTDRQANPLAGASAAAADSFDQATEAFALYRGDPIAHLDAAIADSPHFAMAHLMKAWLLALATEPEATAEAARILAHLHTLPTGDRERPHMAALAELLRGNWSSAGCILERHQMRAPRDLLSLQVGHMIDFCSANARTLRDRVARALPFWSPATPGRSFVLGMHAFGLEEAGDYAAAEQAGRAAIAAEPRDCWAHHAVAHVMEMQGRHEEGLAWIETRTPHWDGGDNFFRVHNWWHRALCHISLGDAPAALALYDGPIRGARSPVALDMIDASALLWRLDLAGIDVGDRWAELSAAWESHANGRLYAFNDWHAAMAHLGAERMDQVARILDAGRAEAPGEAAGWMRGTGLDLIEGFAAFRRGDWAEAVTRLHAGRAIANLFGGSHAQRDVIDLTLTEAALRGGMRDVAEALAHERLALRPHSPVNRAFLERAQALPMSALSMSALPVSAPPARAA